MRLFLIFFVTSVGAAVLNYLFQILLAYKLGAELFPRFTLIWSYYGMASIVGVFFQYWSSLNYFSKKHEENVIRVAHVLSLASVIGSLLFKMPTLVVAALVLESVALALIVGRSISESDFRKVNVINLSTSLIKIILLLVLPMALVSTANIFYIVLVSFVATEISCRFLKSSKEIPKREKHEWVAPLLFAFLISTLPQIDIVWVHWFKSEESLKTMAELSLITKAAFFLQLIISQWLIPLQANKKKVFHTNRYRYAVLFFCILIAGSAIGALVFPMMLKYVLPGSSGSSWSDVFLAIINAGLMSMFYQLCQWSILNKKNLYVISGIGGLMVVLGIAGAMSVSMTNYFIVSILAYILIEIVLLRKITRAS